MQWEPGRRVGVEGEVDVLAEAGRGGVHLSVRPVQVVAWERLVKGQSHHLVLLAGMTCTDKDAEYTNYTYPLTNALYSIDICYSVQLSNAAVN